MPAEHNPNCTMRGPHFVPPSFGDPGFYMCMTPEAIKALWLEHSREVLRSYAPGSERYEAAKAYLVANAEATQ